MTSPAGRRPRLDPERMRLARALAREERRLLLPGLALSLAYFAAWWAWAHGPLLAWLESRIASSDLRLLAYVLPFALGWGLISLPLAAHRHRRAVHYGLSVQGWRDWLADLGKGAFVGALLGLPLLLGFYRLLVAFPASWWLWAGLGYLLVTVLLAQLAPVLIAPLFLKFTPYHDEDLNPRLRALAEEAGTHVRGVYRTDLSSKTTAANAWLSGLGRTRRIVLGDTLLDRYRAGEIVAVFAHEMGHHVHGDLWRSILVSSLANLVGFWLAGRVLAWAVTSYRFSGPADLAAFPWLVLALILFGSLTSPLLNAYSRAREWAADRYAWEHGPGASSFADALTRLANQNLADPAPPRWQVWLAYSHPPVLERIAAARQAAGFDSALDPAHPTQPLRQQSS